MPGYPEHTAEFVGDIIFGYLAETSSVSNVNLLSTPIPAYRTWYGVITMVCCCSEAAAGAAAAVASVTVAVVGTGTPTPPTGTTIAACEALAAANAATGLTGTQGNNSASIPVVIYAGTSTCQLQITTFENGGSPAVYVFAFGTLGPSPNPR